MNHQVRRIAVALDLLRGHDDNIDRRFLAAKVTINARSEPPTMELTALDDQKIDVAVRPHLPAGRRAEQDDLVRLRRLDHAADDVAEDGGFWPAIFGLDFGAQHRLPPIAYAKRIGTHRTFIAFRSVCPSAIPPRP